MLKQVKDVVPKSSRLESLIQDKNKQHYYDVGLANFGT